MYEFALEAETRGLVLLSPSVGGVVLDGSKTESRPTISTWEQQIELLELSPEERELATNARDALVVKYKHQRKENVIDWEGPYTAEDFSLIKTTREVDGKKEDVFTVILSATDPIILIRSWDGIVGDKTDKFILDTDGRKLDERAGLTLEVMSELTARDHKIDERIWETGAPERAHALSAPFVDAHRGVAFRNHSHLRGVTSINYVAFFRPAVVIAVHPQTLPLAA